MIRSHDPAEKPVRTKLIKMMVDSTKMAMNRGHLADARDYVRALLALYPTSRTARSLLHKISARLQAKNK